ncbi:odorant receptor 173 [Nasonia vitripennis]|uniref:Odorant receptor n=1 Tax=Nasonia vitripennis TaxID=7425 RepID=A0A7M6UPQ4_NASVI|nr:odorant receptor 173 [Nasonia vitripennis]
MDIFDGRYYKTSKWFLEFLGLWPFQSNRRRYVTCFIFVFMTATVVFPQVLLLIELKTSNFNILIENSLSIIFGFACLLKYGVTFASRSRLQTLLTQIASDWQRLTDKAEIDILSQYGEEGRYLVLFYTVYVFLAWVTCNFVPFIPPLLDILLPLENGTHDLVYPFYADYVFFKQTDYHYESCLHVFFVYFGTTSLFAGMDTIYVATVKHSCGLFAITWLETMARTGKSNRSNYSIKPNSVVHHDMVEAIVMHNETIRFVELLEDSFSLCFLMVQCMIVAGLATLCFYMMRIYDKTFNMCQFSTFTVGLVIHLLYLHWVGQKIIDSSDKVFYSTYYSDWYLISRNERQLTKIILARSLYPCQLTAGKISVLSMETFGALMKTSMSYCTVLLSVS